MSKNAWGYVDPGTIVKNQKGERFRVCEQDESGFLNLENLSGGEPLAFEVLDPIDHELFTFVD